MRTFLRGKVTLLFMTLGMLLALPAVALADRLDADADSLATGTGSSGNSLTANQQPGTTKTYDFSAAVIETGNATDNVFVNAGDKVTVNNSFAGDWLDAAGSSPASFEITAYGQNHSGVISVTVPCNAKTTSPADSKAMTVSLSATASNGNTLTSATQTLTYTITASGSPAASCTPANNAPTVSTAALDASGDEGSELTTSGAFSDKDGDTLTITKKSGVGTVTPSTTTPGEWSWSHTPNDNGTGTVEVQASDGKGGTAVDEFTWTATNVAPTVTSVSPSVTNALVNKNVTFTGSATDPSSVDTTAGFFWQWSTDGVNYGPALPSPFLVPNTYSNQYTTSFAECGSKSVSAQATDKDLGTSAAVTSPSVNVYKASYSAPLNEGMQNLVQKGRVIPVKISVGCATNLTGLQPSIQLLKGDHAAGTESGTDNVETLSVSSADTTGIMRAIDGGYIYNLQVPSTAAANELYTIRVNPFGGTSASSNMYIVLKIRK